MKRSALVFALLLLPMVWSGCATSASSRLQPSRPISSPNTFEMHEIWTRSNSVWNGRRVAGGLLRAARQLQTSQLHLRRIAQQVPAVVKDPSLKRDLCRTADRMRSMASALQRGVLAAQEDTVAHASPTK